TLPKEKRPLIPATVADWVEATTWSVPSTRSKVKPLRPGSPVSRWPLLLMSSYLTPLIEPRWVLVKVQVTVSAARSEMVALASLTAVVEPPAPTGQTIDDRSKPVPVRSD